MNADSTLQIPTGRLDEPALARCHAVTTRESNHLHAAASRLSSPRRYEFFLASYAAMRVLDDMVDLEFLAQPASRRGALRQGMLDELERWESQVEAASRGRYRAREDDLEPLVFTALNELLASSDLGAQPFRRLAKSLRRDLEERSLENRDDFLEYSEGAAVAPGAIFLYLLAAEERPDGSLGHPRSAEMLDFARDLAHYCYLTHIARDLAEDAAQDQQLLTIPADWLADAGFSRDSFRQAARDEDDAVRPIVHRLLDEAQAAGSRAELRLAEFERELCMAHRQILDYLFGLYRDAHEGVVKRWR